MKRIHHFLLSILLTPLICVGEPVPVETFDKLDEKGRQKVIDQAPPSQKEEFKKIDWHLHLVRYWGGEEALKTAKESNVARARGLGWIEGPVVNLKQLWQSYEGDKIAGGATKGLKGKALVDAEQSLADVQMTKMKALDARQKLVHSLVFHLAPTPQAFALNEQAEKLCQAISKRVMLQGVPTRQNITDQERATFERLVDEFLSALQKLTTLPDVVVQREYEAFPEDKIPSDGFGR